MSELKHFGNTHRIVTAAQFMADDNRPVDLTGNYRPATIHAYTWSFPDGSKAVYYILEMKDGFHFMFSHPCDEVAATLDDAEVELFEQMIAN